MAVQIIQLVILAFMLLCLRNIAKELSLLVNAVKEQATAQTFAPVPQPVVSMPPVSVAAFPYASGAQTNVKLYGVDEPTAALIMSAVSAETNIDPSELCFRSIKLVNPSEAYEIELHDVDEQSAAVIMTIVANEMKTPVSGLHFRSIRAA